MVSETAEDMMPASVDDMVANLTEARADVAGRDGRWPMPVEVAAERMAVDPDTLEAWEGYRAVPSLPQLVVWQAVFSYRSTLTDCRGRRWDRGFTPFGPPQWGVPERLDAFAVREIGRLTDAVVRAMRALGFAIAQLDERDGRPSVQITPGVGLGLGLGHVGMSLKRFVDLADAVGLCLSMDPIDQLPSESVDEDRTALSPEWEITA